MRVQQCRLMLGCVLLTIGATVGCDTSEEESLQMILPYDSVDPGIIGRARIMIATTRQIPFDPPLISHHGDPVDTGLEIRFTVVDGDKTALQHLNKFDKLVVASLVLFFDPKQYIDQETGLKGEILNVEISELEYEGRVYRSIYLVDGDTWIKCIDP